jgi:hypothetical protein
MDGWHRRGSLELRSSSPPSPRTAHHPQLLVSSHSRTEGGSLRPWPLPSSSAAGRLVPPPPPPPPLLAAAAVTLESCTCGPCWLAASGAACCCCCCCWSRAAAPWSPARRRSRELGRVGRCRKGCAFAAGARCRALARAAWRTCVRLLRQPPPRQQLPAAAAAPAAERRRLCRQAGGRRARRGRQRQQEEGCCSPRLHAWDGG